VILNGPWTLSLEDSEFLLGACPVQTETDNDRRFHLGIEPLLQGQQSFLSAEFTGTVWNRNTHAPPGRRLARKRNRGAARDAGSRVRRAGFCVHFSQIGSKKGALATLTASGRKNGPESADWLLT
jgi:hypothetical protein